MPFTLCHPAIVIPLHRYARAVTSLPALVIGSMMPDFVYFFSFGVSGSFTHSPAGILLYCVPAGAAIYLLYYGLLRQPLLAWLPQAVGTRMAWRIPAPVRRIRAAGIVLLSLGVGAASHLVWDGFTHRNTLFVNHFAPLRALVPVGGHDIPVFKILQQLSSLVGFLAIAGCTRAWLSRSEPGPPSPHAFDNKQRVLALAVVSAAAAAGGTWGLVVRRAASIEHGLFNAVTAGMTTAAVAILLLCIGWHACADKRTR